MLDHKDLEAFVTKVLNAVKEETEPTRQHILEGAIDEIGEYKREIGFLQGAEIVCAILMEVGRTHIKETLDGE